MNRLFVLLILLLYGVKGWGQSVLQNYLDSALENNLVLQQKNISSERAEYALKLAKSMFLPNVNLQGGYTTAGGGRDIPLPLGDLLNGAYATLNQLTQTQRFPQLKNEKVTFLPANFYDVKVHTTIPIYNSSLNYNRKISEQQIQLNSYDLTIYKRDLVKDVKAAYYQYLQAREALDIYQSALKLAQEGKRVNEKLLENGKGLPAHVLRSESEIEDVQAKIIASEKKAENAGRYFNFLLNRDQESEVLVDSEMIRTAERIIIQILADSISANHREELSALDEVTRLKKNIVDMNKAERNPSLNGFLDLGSQAQNWKFDSQSRYYMIGLQLAVPIYTAGKTKYKVREAELDVKSNELNRAEAAHKLDLAIVVAKNNLLSSYQQYLSSKKRLEAAEAYHRLTDRGYKEGVNPYLETVDARTQLTNARLSTRINFYQVLIDAANLEREQASYPLNK